jgi:SpoVK/Ycf46/Vps4 family AAA+-type ATPase
MPVVGGSPAALSALEELISWPMLHAAEAAALGVRWPRGVLLHGPPGCGKSLLVAAAAARSGAALHRLSAGDVVGAWAGESERNLRAAFAAAQAAVAGGQPCVLFLDEVDALCPRRGAGGAHEDRLTAQLLVLMDGATEQEREGRGGARLLLVGATNRPEALDPALRRPGRFEVELEVEVPGPCARADILAAHTARLPLAPGVDLAALAQRCHGYSGADLAALAREAAMVAIEEEASGTMPLVSAAHFSTARSRVGASLVRGTSVEAPAVRWEDIGGLEGVKHRLRQAVEWPLTHSPSFARLGVRPPKGVLLHGPPGCSKTQLARAAAAASGATLIPLTGSQLFSMYLGAGERLLAAAFARARAAAPAIIFLDEVDSVACARREGAGAGGGGSGAEERLLSTLLTELDGILPSAGVMLLCATNRAEVLDPALLRPGRLDVHLYVPPPDAAGRAAVLRIHTRGMALSPEVDLAELAVASDGYTGAELAGVCVEAAQVAVRARGPDVQRVEQADFEAALAAMPPSLTPQMLAAYAAFNAQGARMRHSRATT